MYFSKETELGGKKLILESGKVARQANGSCLLSYGDSMALVTACASSKANVDMGFFPLTVEFREKFYASGKIPGGFIKREGRPSNREILSARIIDRPIRPLFPDKFRNEVQIICNVISSDGENLLDTVSIIGVSLALNLSDIPFSGPVAGVRVGRLNGELIINPSLEEMKQCDIELVMSGGKGFISMVEGESKEISEEEMIEALEFGQKEIDRLCQFQEEIIAEYSKEKFEFEIPEIDREVVDKVSALSKEKLAEIINIKNKKARNSAKVELFEEVLEAFGEDVEEKKSSISEAFHDMEKELVRGMIFNDKVRIDGRGPEDIRTITCETDILPRSHGSALFTRGETQSLGVCTLGSSEDTQLVEDIFGKEDHSFYLHYNFPPFSVGEVGRKFGVSRREVGHGHLAERSFHAVLPEFSDFPYTVRLVSEILESNGSSSMASVCSNSMAMMAAGVPLKEAVSGIAMGLVKEGEKTVILSDILGDEDHLGDMDFKVTGTRNGICAYQMDIKIQGISSEIMMAALKQAKQGRIHILEQMDKAINVARQELSSFAPRIISMQIASDEIATLIGPGGKNIKEITAEYGVKIDIEDDGSVKIFSESDSGERAKEHIKSMFAKPEAGQIYDAKVVDIKDFGAFVDFMPNQSGLLHISEIALERVEKVTDYLKKGDIIKVKFVGKDNKGRNKLVRKEILQAEKKAKE